MKIKCYGPEVLNEENKKYLLENSEIYGKVKLYLEKIRLAWPYMFMGILVIYAFSVWQNMNLLKDITNNLLVGLLGLLLLIVLLKYIFKLKRKINRDFKGVIVNLVDKIILIENKQEKKEFFERDKGFLSSLKKIYRDNVDYGKLKRIYLKLYNRYQEGEILDHIEFEQENYILIKIRFKIDLNKLKKTYYIEDFFAIMSREDYNRFKEIEKDYMFEIK
jgi:hypothetical protein